MFDILYIRSYIHTNSLRIEYWYSGKPVRPIIALGIKPDSGSKIVTTRRKGMVVQAVNVTVTEKRLPLPLPDSAIIFLFLEDMFFLNTWI
jgi:hypothetical protein